MAQTKRGDEPRWSRIGLTQAGLHRWWSNVRRGLLRRRAEAEQPDHVPDQTEVVFPAQAMAAAQIGYEGDGTPPRPRDFAPDTVPAALRYFYGGWRRDPEVYGESPRGSYGWYEGYRWGVVAALALRHDDATLGRLLAWPGEDLFVDEGTWDASPEDNAVHIAFARLLRGELVDLGSLKSRLERARPTHPKLLFAAFEAVATGAQNRLGLALHQLIRWHRGKREKEPRYDWLNVDASIAWLIAKRRGMDVERSGLEQADRDYLMGEL